MEFYAPYRRQPGVIIPIWLLSRPELSSGSKILYGRLCRYCGRNYPDLCWPRVQTLANETGQSKRQTQRYIAELVEQGLVTVEHDPKHSSVYRFLVHPWMENGVVPSSPGDPDEEYHGRDDGGVTDPSPPPRHIRRGGDVKCVAPPPPLSSSLEYRSGKKENGSRDKSQQPRSLSHPSGLAEFKKRFDEAWAKKYGDVRPHDRQDSKHAREIFEAAGDACRRAGAPANSDELLEARLDKWTSSFLALSGWADDQRHSLWAMSRSIARLVEPSPVKTRYREIVPEVIPEEERVPLVEVFATMKRAANGELAPPPLTQGELFQGD